MAQTFLGPTGLSAPLHTQKGEYEALLLFFVQKSVAFFARKKGEVWLGLGSLCWGKGQLCISPAQKNRLIQIRFGKSFLSGHRADFFLPFPPFRIQATAAASERTSSFQAGWIVCAMPDHPRSPKKTQRKKE